MEVLYNQKAVSDSTLSNFGIDNCILRHIYYKQDSSTITNLVHHHTSYEIHIVVDGSTSYEVEGTVYRVTTGHFLLLPPYLKHRFIESEAHTVKYSLVFHFTPEQYGKTILPDHYAPFFASATEEMLSGLHFIHAEFDRHKSISDILIENRVLECIFIYLRLLGLQEETAEPKDSASDVRLQLAKQFVSENIELNLTVENLAQYCHLSSKQLTRIFRQEEQITPLAYIKRQRLFYAKKLLANKTLSLREISEIMHFSSEYYFHTFFKKEEGMPPGAYRKMIP